MPIQFILIALVALALLVLIRGRTVANRAWTRIILILLAIFAVVSLIFPSTVSWVAGLVGVGRGTDLVLYFLVIAFLYSLVVVYQRMNKLEERITLLARRIALMEESEDPNE